MHTIVMHASLLIAGAVVQFEASAIHSTDSLVHQEAHERLRSNGEPCGQHNGQ